MGLNLNMEAKKNGENDQNDDNVPFVYWQIFGITLHAYYNSLQDFILEKKTEKQNKKSAGERRCPWVSCFISSLLSKMYGILFLKKTWPASYAYLSSLDYSSSLLFL